MIFQSSSEFKMPKMELQVGNKQITFNPLLSLSAKEVMSISFFFPLSIIF